MHSLWSTILNITKVLTDMVLHSYWISPIRDFRCMRIDDFLEKWIDGISGSFDMYSTKWNMKCCTCNQAVLNVFTQSEKINTIVTKCMYLKHYSKHHKHIHQHNVIFMVSLRLSCMGYVISCDGGLFVKGIVTVSLIYMFSVKWTMKCDIIFPILPCEFERRHFELCDEILKPRLEISLV